jgi:hypothetical protein
MGWAARAEFLKTATEAELHTALIWQWSLMGVLIVGLLAFSFYKSEWGDKSA